MREANEFRSDIVCQFKSTIPGLPGRLVGSLPSLLLTLLLCLSVPLAAAPLATLGSISLTNLQFSSDDPRAELFWLDLWYGASDAYSEDSTGAWADDFNDFLGHDELMAVSAVTPYADANGASEVATGEWVTMLPEAFIHLSSIAAISGVEGAMQGLAESNASIDNYFTVIGGDPGESVDISFTADYDAWLLTANGDQALVDHQLGAVLLIEDIDGTILADDVATNGISGAVGEHQQHVNGQLSINWTLEFEGEYWLYAATSADSFAVQQGVDVSAPASAWLLGGGLWALLGYRRRQRS